jgi:hypothetical protein
MKKIVVFSLVLFLQGLNSFGQTNTAPSTGHLLPRPEAQGQKGASKLKNAGAPVTPAGGTLSTNTQILPAKLVTSQGVKKQESQWRLWGPVQAKDYGAELNGIFQPQNDQADPASIRDTIVTIFPSGR